MSIIDLFLSSGLTALILYVIFLLSYKFISNYMNNYIEHEFNKRIENFKTELQQKHQEQQHFHDLLLKAIFEENKDVKSRKIAAIDSLWKSILSMKKFSLAVKFLASLKMEKIKKHANDPEIQQFLKSFPLCSVAELRKEMESTRDNQSELARPWISHKAWSLYLAYFSIINYAIFQFENAKRGGDLENIFDTQKMLELLQNVLPDLEINEISHPLLTQWLDLLEVELLIELKISIDNKEDPKAIERVIKISNIISEMKRENLNVPLSIRKAGL